MVLFLVSGTAPAEEVGTRQNPLEMGEEYILSYDHWMRGRVSIKIALVDVVRGDESAEMEEVAFLREAKEQIPGLVFSEAGQPIDPDRISKTFPRLAKKHGHGGMRFHDLRHTHATILLSQRVPPKVVAERLGHYDISITLRTYAHYAPDMQKEAAQAFREAVKKRPRGVRGEAEK